MVWGSPGAFPRSFTFVKILKTLNLKPKPETLNTKP